MANLSNSQGHILSHGRRRVPGFQSKVCENEAYSNDMVAAKWGLNNFREMTIREADVLEWSSLIWQGNLADKSKNTPS